MCDTCTQESLKGISGLARHTLGTPGNFAPGEGTVPLLPGEALTGVLAGSGQWLRVRELETKAKGSRKGKKDNVFPAMCQMGKQKPREAE